MHTTHHNNCNDAFTLVELSVVLVIIGLLVGGILLGRDLIKSSEIRATISQQDKFNIAANAFKLKYGYLPGDLPSATASGFGFYYVSGAISGTYAMGDGNGRIQGYTAPWDEGGTFGGEIAMFFLHLSQASLIEGAYGMLGPDVTITGATTAGGSSGGAIPGPSIDTTATTTGQLLPLAKLGQGNYFTIGSYRGTNYFVITGITIITTAKDVTSTNNLSPLDAYAIDSKIDDGLPATGVVFALNTTSPVLSNSNGAGLSTASSNNCANSGAYYTSSSTYASALNCSLRLKFQ